MSLAGMGRWALLALAVFSRGQEAVDGEKARQATPERPKLALTITRGDDLAVLTAALRFAERCGEGWTPWLIAQEPGPLNTRQGLRLLANEVFPRATPPDLWVISTLGELRIDNLLTAFVRRCLLAGGEVWIVGPTFPEALAAMPLEPGQRIERIDSAELEARLAARFDAPP